MTTNVPNFKCFSLAGLVLTLILICTGPIFLSGQTDTADYKIVALLLDTSDIPLRFPDQHAWLCGQNIALRAVYTNRGAKDTFSYAMHFKITFLNERGGGIGYSSDRGWL